MKYLSIVTTVYNAEDSIEETILSVLKQKSEYVEYVVIDGGSNDRTLDIINSYQAAIDCIVSELDFGVYDGMNKGVGKSKGEYIYFLQAGDQLRDGVISKVVECIKDNGNRTALIYGDVYWKQLGIVYDGLFDKYKLTRKNICQQAIFYNKKLFDELGMFDLSYKIVADYVFNLKCYGRKNIYKYYMNEIIADYDCGMSASGKDKKLTRYRRYILIYKNLGVNCLLYAVLVSFVNLMKKCLCLGSSCD